MPRNIIIDTTLRAAANPAAIKALETYSTTTALFLNLGPNPTLDAYRSIEGEVMGGLRSISRPVQAPAFAAGLIKEEWERHVTTGAAAPSIEWRSWTHGTVFRSVVLPVYERRGLLRAALRMETFPVMEKAIRERLARSRS